MLKRRVVIVDSDEEFTAGLVALVRNSDKFVLVNKYADAREALKRLTDDLPDIVVMDLDFPQIKGAQFIMKARERIPKLDMLVVTDHDDGEEVLSAISNGAVGYLLKNRCITYFLNALSTVARGGAALDPHVARFIISSMQITEGSPLSVRETMVLKLMVQGKTSRLIGNDLNISSETVKTHMRNIYRKLKVSSKAEAIRKAVSERLVSSHLGLQMNQNVANGYSLIGFYD